VIRHRDALKNLLKQSYVAEDIGNSGMHQISGCFSEKRVWRRVKQPGGGACAVRAALEFHSRVDMLRGPDAHWSGGSPTDSHLCFADTQFSSEN